MKLIKILSLFAVFVLLSSCSATVFETEPKPISTTAPSAFTTPNQTPIPTQPTTADPHTQPPITIENPTTSLTEPTLPPTNKPSDKPIASTPTPDSYTQSPITEPNAQPPITTENPTISPTPEPTLPPTNKPSDTPIVSTPTPDLTTTPPLTDAPSNASASAPYSNDTGIKCINSNHKLHTPFSLVSVDETNETVYFVNYGRDNYLYAYKNGKSELILEKPVNFITYWDGSLYFISNDSSLPSIYDAFYTGKLYKYDLTNKTLELLTDMNVNYLTVNQYGIYFYAGENGTITGYHLTFYGNTVNRIGNFEPIFYGDYQLKNTFAGNRHQGKVLDSGTNELSVSIPADSMYYSIVGNKFYSMSVGVVNVLDLSTGEQNSYLINKVAILADDWYKVEMERIADYAVIGNELYVTAGNHFIYRYDTAAKSFVPVNSFDGNRHYEKLFTDGVNLYALEIEYANGKIVNTALRLFTPDNNGNFVLSDLVSR